MKRITIEIPDGYADVVSITAVGSETKSETCRITNLMTRIADITEHGGDVLVLVEKGDIEWRDEDYAQTALVEELTEKHWGECRQIAHYDNDLKKFRWIPCSERLPEAEVPVLVCSEHRTVYIADWNGEAWEYENDMGDYVDCDFKHTHWMPLPEPPEGC